MYIVYIYIYAIGLWIDISPLHDFHGNGRLNLAPLGYDSEAAPGRPSPSQTLTMTGRAPVIT